MTPEQAVIATHGAVHDVPAVFMLHGSTYGRGAELGYEGIDFYTCGRGAPLGDVDADVVAASFVFFSPTYIRGAWERGASVESRAQAAVSFMECGYGWARRKLDTENGGVMASTDLARLAELLTVIVDTASPACAPLFGAHRAMTRPGVHDAAALVLHLLDSLRELRGGLHGAAVVANGLTPLEALSIHTPHMVPIFGWTEPAPVADPSLEGRWHAAETATNMSMARAFAVLDAASLNELVELCARLPTAST